VFLEPAVNDPSNHRDKESHAHYNPDNQPGEGAAVLVLIVPATAVLTGEAVITVNAVGLLS
jgi:hypothetical protein